MHLVFFYWTLYLLQNELQYTNCIISLNKHRFVISWRELTFKVNIFPLSHSFVVIFLPVRTVWLSLIHVYFKSNPNTHYPKTQKGWCSTVTWSECKLFESTNIPVLSELDVNNRQWMSDTYMVQTRFSIKYDTGCLNAWTCDSFILHDHEIHFHMNIHGISRP